MKNAILHGFFVFFAKSMDFFQKMWYNKEKSYLRRYKIYRYIKNYVNETQIDALGNLICVRKALPKKGKKPLKIGFFCAVDAPGRIVTYIEENGLVRTAAIGKTDLKFAAYSKVVTADEKYTGILVPENFKAEKDAVSEPLFADFGFENESEAAEHISVGDLLCFADEPVRLPSKTGKTVYAPALGNKLCAAVLAELAHKTEPADAFELSFAFCAQSALGARGAAPAAFSLTPDIAVCLDAANRLRAAIYRRGTHWRRRSRRAHRNASLSRKRQRLSTRTRRRYPVRQIHRASFTVSASALMQKVPYSRTEKRRCKTGEKRKRIAKPTAFFGVSALPVHARHKNAVAGKGRLFG